MMSASSHDEHRKLCLALAWFGYLALCSAYILGGVDKILDFPGAVVETRHLGVPFPLLATIATIIVELLGSALILSGCWRWCGALLLAGFTVVANMLANAFWRLPDEAVRTLSANAFFEHWGLIGGFLLIALRSSSGFSRPFLPWKIQ
ncbi:DoxX family protein [Nguyenibacter vanlangensis]|uniref:DoxX family protein n=1 Tax=Nguyenibacter vanlangensis TaxID=1216886 RepID=A0ABZ3D9X1_9PROT